MPSEVVESIKKTYEQSPNANITVNTDIENQNESISTYSTSSSWGSARKYKGYKIKDWTIKINNAFDMTRIKSGKSSYGFASTMFMYAATSIADTIIPFSSAAITAGQYLVKASDRNNVTAAYMMNVCVLQKK